MTPRRRHETYTGRRRRTYNSKPTNNQKTNSTNPMKTMTTMYPLPKEFRALVCPTYLPGDHTLGDWHLFRAPTVDGSAPAYFTPHAPMPREYWVLTRNGETWMSLTPMELQSQGHHARLAAGEVLVLGLGMGALVYNLLRNPNVTAITVCEREPEVVTLLTQAAPWFATAVQSGRVEIQVMDAFTYRSTRGKPETLLVDIWPGLGNSQAEPDVLLLHRTIGARQVGWWGQELAFWDWVSENIPGQDRIRLRKDHAAAYEKHLGFPLLGANLPYYPEVARAAARIVAVTMMMMQNPASTLWSNLLSENT